MSATEVATIIKLQPTARAYRIIPLCTRGRSICLQQTELIASQAVSYYCFIPRPPAPCAPPAPYGPGSAPAALAPYLPLGRLQPGSQKETYGTVLYICNRAAIGAIKREERNLKRWCGHAVPRLHCNPACEGKAN